MADIFNTLGRNNSGGIWGSITGNILDQTDLINYLEDNYYPLNTNPSGYLTLSDLPPQTLQDLQSVTDVGNTITDGTNTMYVNPSGIEIQGAVKQMQVLIDQLIFIDGINSSSYLMGFIYNNGVNYPLPTGASSQIATLADLPTLLSELTNDVGYITEQRVEEYPDFASFPLIGEEEVVYIAADTGLFYSWNGSTYISSSPPISGITGGGIINRLPKFTPDGTTLGSSNFSDTGFEGRYSLSATNFVSFYPTGNIWIRLQRSLGNHMDFILGNAGVSQTASLTANNTHGVEVVASAASAFLALRTNTSEGLRVLPTGQLRFTQTPSAGTTSDSVLVRDSSGNIKTVEYPTSFVFKNTTQTVVTGTTSETIIYAEEVLANTISNNTILSFRNRIYRNPRAGTCTYKLYINTVNNLTGSPVQIGRLDASTNQGSNPLERDYLIKDNILSGFQFNAAVVTDLTTANVSKNTTTYNINTTYYWILTAQLNTSSDSLTHSFSILERI